jgi:hypothetical protein
MLTSKPSQMQVLNPFFFFFSFFGLIEFGYLVPRRVLSNSGLSKVSGSTVETAT